MQHQKLLLLVGQTETKMDLMIVIAILFATDPTDLMEMDLMEMDLMEMDLMEMDLMEMDLMEMGLMDQMEMDCAARSHVKYVSQ